MSKRKTLVPILRFPEFKEEWSGRKLGNLSTIKSASRVHKNEWTEHGVPFFRSSDVVSYYKGTNNRKAFISRELFDELSAKSGKIRKHDLLVTGGGSIGIPYLVPNDAPLYFKDADLLWFKISERIHSYFLYFYLSTFVFRRYLASVSHIGTIAHYTIEQAKLTPVTLPTLPEQRKIADFLTAVDRRIQLLSQKKALLEDYKKGVMQQLFTQVLRFKDDHGNEFPDWEEMRVEDMFQVTRGKVLAMPETHSEPSGVFQYPVYSSQTRANGLAGYYNKFLFRDAITWTTDGANAGDVRYRKGEFYCTNVCGVLLSNKGFANEFVAAMLGTVTRNHVSYVGNPKLMNNVMSKISISVPSSIAEQTMISNFLSALDRKIESVASQITHTLTFKKGLLQQMFI